MDDMALRIDLDLGDALASSRELHQQLRAIELETQAVAASAQTMATELTASQTRAATFANSAVQTESPTVTATGSIDQPVAAVNESVSASATEAEASLTRVDAALEQTKTTAEATGNFIKENPLLTFSLINAVSKAAGAGSLIGAAGTFAASMATTALTAITVTAATTLLTVGALATGFVLLGQVIPTGRIDEVAESIGVARNETELLTAATMQLVEAQRSGASGEVVAASFKAADTQRGRSVSALPTIDTREAAIATAIGGKAEDAVKVAGQIVYEIDVPALNATAKEARRSVATIAEDLARVSASTSGSGWGQISTLSAIANLSDASVKDLGASVEELRIRAHTNAAAFESLGINVLTAEGTLQSSAAVAQQFAAAMDGMSSAERTAAMETLGLSEAAQSVVNDMAKQATAISESRDAITASNELTASQERARIGNQLSSLTTMAEAVGSRLKNWSDATIEAVSRPLSKAAADLTEWAGGGIASALETLDGWLAAIESKVTGVDVSKLTLLGETDKPQATAEKPQAAPMEFRERPLDRIEELKQEIAIREKLAATRAAGADEKGSKAPQKSEEDKALEAELQDLEKQRDAIYGIQRQLDDIGLTKAEQRKSELMADGYTAANASRLASAETRLDIETKILAATRERDRVMLNAADKAGAEARDSGWSAESAEKLTAILSETEAEKELIKARRELAQLSMTDASKSAADFNKLGATDAQQAEMASINAQKAVKKELLDIEKERQKLANETAVKQLYGGESDAVQREALAGRERMERIRKETSDTAVLAQAQEEQDRLLTQRREASDRDRAKQLTEQYDPTIKLRQDREELDRLHGDGLILDDTYAKGVAEIEEKWNKATGAVEKHRDVLNKGIDAYSTEAIDAVMRGIALNGLDAPKAPAASPLPAVGSTPSPLTPPAPNALALPAALPQATPIKDSEQQRQLAVVADLLAKILTAMENVRESSSETADAVKQIADDSETL